MDFGFTPDDVAWKIPLVTLGLMIAENHKMSGVKGVGRNNPAVDKIFERMEALNDGES